MGRHQEPIKLFVSTLVHTGTVGSTAPWQFEIRFEHNSSRENESSVDRYAMAQDNLVRYFYT